MKIETAQYVLFALLAILLVTACVTDWRRREIDNWLNSVIAALALVFWLVSGMPFWPDIATQVGMAALVFAIFAGFFALGAMGGGDVKLLGALALWFAPLDMMWLLIVMSIIGGVLTLFMILRQKWMKLEGKPEIPYGIAIALAGLWLIYERNLNQFSALMQS